MYWWTRLWTIALGGLLTAGCGAGQLLFPDADDDDATGDDDVSDDDDTGDDDTGDDDDVSDDDDTGDDDTGDDDTGDDDDDDDVTPMVECGPFEPLPAGESGRIYSGAGSLYPYDNWVWVGCEVERRFEDGQLDCELLWEVEGGYYDWDEGSQTARYELFFEADEGASSCDVEPDEEEQVWYYRARFDWGSGQMTLWYSNDPWDQGNEWAVATISDQGHAAPFAYRSDVYVD